MSLPTELVCRLFFNCVLCLFKCALLNVTLGTPGRLLSTKCFLRKAPKSSVASFLTEREASVLPTVLSPSGHSQRLTHSIPPTFSAPRTLGLTSAVAEMPASPGTAQGPDSSLLAASLSPWAALHSGNKCSSKKLGGLPGWHSGKAPTCHYRRRRRHGLRPELGRSPGVGMACRSSVLAWEMLRAEATIHGVAKRRTGLSPHTLRSWVAPPGRGAWWMTDKAAFFKGKWDTQMVSFALL